MSSALVIAAAFAYLLALFAVAAWADRRAAAGRSVIANPWVYALSLGVYCSAWTYFGSVGRADEQRGGHDEADQGRDSHRDFRLSVRTGRRRATAARPPARA